MMQLETLFTPKSVAVVGASPNLQKVGGRTLYFLQRSNYQGRIYPVNPNYTEINGLPAYKDLSDLPEPPEQIILCIPSERVLPVLEEAVKKGVRSAIVFAGGFAETGEQGKQLEEQMRRLAEQHSLALLGPNCMGFIYQQDYVGTYTSILEENETRQSDIAFIGQSGAIGAYSFVLAKQRGLSIGTLISTGNELLVDVADCLRFLSADPRINIFLTYFEGCKNGRKLEEALQAARENGKIVLACKVGRTTEGMRAAQSHTANMVGDDDVYDALFEKYNVVRCADIDELVEVAELLARGVQPKGNRVGMMSVSGGIGVLATDLCVENGLQVPLFEEETRERMRAIVPFAGVSNPMDPTAQGTDNPETLGKMLEIMVRDANIDVAVLNFGYFLLSEERGPVMAEVVRKVAEASPVPVVVTGLHNHRVKRMLQDWGIPLFADLSRCIRALSLAVRLRAVCRQQSTVQLSRTPAAQVDLPPAADRAALVDLLRRHPYLTEYEGKRLLHAFGINVPASRMACGEQEVLRAASELRYPVVLKISDRNILHKSDLGGVHLNLRNEQELLAAYRKMVSDDRLAQGRRQIPVIVEEMIEKPMAAELIANLRVDPVFGPVIVVGMGGLLTELLHDVVVLKPPLAPEDIVKGLERLKGYRLLAGYRNRPRADVPALIEAIQALERIGRQMGDVLSEIEINPLAVFAEGEKVMALDAVVKGRGEGLG